MNSMNANFAKRKRTNKLSFSICMEGDGHISLYAGKGPNSMVTAKDIDGFIDTAEKQLEKSRKLWKEINNKSLVETSQF